MYNYKEAGNRKRSTACINPEPEMPSPKRVNCESVSGTQKVGDLISGKGIPPQPDFYTTFVSCNSITMTIGGH